MFSPCPKNSASPSTRFGSIGLGVDRALHRVGREHHDQVGLLAGLERRDDPQPLRVGPLAALGALGQADPDVDAGVAQRQRVGVPLAAVAEDRHVAALDHGQVGVVVVVELGHVSCAPQLCLCWW